MRGRAGGLQLGRSGATGTSPKLAWNIGVGSLSTQNLQYLRNVEFLW